MVDVIAQRADPIADAGEVCLPGFGAGGLSRRPSAGTQIPGRPGAPVWRLPHNPAQPNHSGRRPR